MILRLLIALSVATTLFCTVHSQVSQELRRLCNGQSECRDCIQASHLCIWCADPNFNGTSRCYPSNDPTANCEPSMVQNPEGSSTETMTPPLQGNTQISPSTIAVSVRPGQPIMFPISVRPARNFPIDIYLLMDLSFSMRDDLANLKRLGADLAGAIVGISENFRIGFGSFVDKPVGPFVNLRPEIQNNPCLGNSNFPNGCVSTYSYRHHVSLTTNASFFNERVQAQNISGNQDTPEGGFDGFLQSIVCTDLVGWRDVSRKLLLYITDAGFHYANDGKLGGIVVPHDGLCRMPTQSPSDGMNVDYEQWNVYDYPSIGQIANALREADIIPIFAAEANAKPVYDELVLELGDGAFSGTLAADSSNVVTLVQDIYNTISQRIVFDPSPIPGVSFMITPRDCPGVVTAGTCTGVEIEQTATFDVSVALTECNEQNSGSTIDVPVRVVGFGTFTVQLSAICRCPCEDTPIVDSPVCNNQGNLTCGICNCASGRLGDNCQCDATGIGGGMNLTCPIGPTEIECTRNDRGTCVCGQCVCREGITGPACECDESRCGRFNDQLCSGRGMCTCNGCQCNVEPTTNMPYYSGDAQACECTPATDCVDPRNSTMMCNGHGTCGCAGTCECDDPYFGRYCGRCSGSDVCLLETCSITSICAQCALNVIAPYADLPPEEFFNNMTILTREGIPAGTRLEFNSTTNVTQLILPPTNEYCEMLMENPDVRCPVMVIINGTDDVDYMIGGEDPVPCEGSLDNCVYRYFVAVNTSEIIDPDSTPFLNIHVEFRRSCAQQVAAWIFAIGIIIPLLVLGLLALLLLKILLVIFDHIEFNKFEKELAKTKYSKNENPLYRSAAKDYENPLYGK